MVVKTDVPPSSDESPDIANEELVQNRIYVGGLGDQIGERDLFYYFSGFGEVLHVGIITAGAGGWSKGYGFVTFKCQEVVERLLGGVEGENLVLKGRWLYVGPARQKYFRGQRWRRPEENNIQSKDTSEEKINTPNLANGEVQVDAVQQAGINSFNRYHQDTNSYSYDSAGQPLWVPPNNQVPIYSYPLPSYPQYYPLYQDQGPDYTQYPPVYVQPMPAWYPSSYQATSNPADAYSTYATPNPTYPLAYPNTQEVFYPGAAPTYQTPTGPYWPQTHTFPAPYNYSLSVPNMIQYTYTGESNQSAPGYQNIAGEDQDETVPEHQNTTYTENMSSYTEASVLADSGYQDTNTTGGYQDISSYQYQQPPPVLDYQADNGKNNHQQTKSSVKTTPKNKNDSMKYKTPVDTSISDQNRERFPKRNQSADKNHARSEPSVTNNLKEHKGHPSPYKTFYAGNPSSGLFPFHSGPRPTFSGQGQGRGRGRIWGHRGGNIGVRGETLQRRNKEGMNEVGGDKKVAEKEGPVVPADGEVGARLRGTQPDILQIPLKKLEIK